MCVCAPYGYTDIRANYLRYLTYVVSTSYISERRGRVLLLQYGVILSAVVDSWPGRAQQSLADGVSLRFGLESSCAQVAVVAFSGPSFGSPFCFEANGTLELGVEARNSSGLITLRKPLSFSFPWTGNGEGGGASLVFVGRNSFRNLLHTVPKSIFDLLGVTLRASYTFCWAARGREL